MENTIFTVTNTDLERLSPEAATFLIRDLLWADAARLGIPVPKVHISSHVTAPDGGVDARVEDSSTSGDLIRQGLTSYQIKAGKFSVNGEVALKNELFGAGNAATKVNLKPRIRACAESGGTYILICTAIDPASVDDGKAHLKKLFRKCGFENIAVEILVQNQLVGIIGKYPSIALRVNQRQNIKFQTHSSWSNDAEMQKPFQNGKAQKQFAELLQSALRNATQAVHVHVHGEAGVGKTRLVLEATKAGDLAPLVVYSDAPAEVLRGELLTALLQDNSSLTVLMVIDEANRDSRTRLWDKLKHRGPRVKLVTIYNELEKSSDIPVLEAPLLENEQIAGIISAYGVPMDQAERWATLCSGFPRVGHVIGLNLHTNPDDLLKAPSTVDIWNRFIFGTDDSNSQPAQDRLIVLRYIALFKRFGFDEPVTSEAKALSKAIQQAAPQITWPKFQAIVIELKHRRILQGEKTLYITPKALHVWLWSEWWENHGRGFNLEEFLEGFPPDMIRWFIEMFRYAEQSQVARALVTRLLGPQGPFHNIDFLNSRLGGDFFLALTEVSPGEALACLQQNLDPLSRAQLLEFKEGRRAVIYALQRIAIWKALFAGAARTLLRLADAENESWANNATGVFADLFSPGVGQVAPSEASPGERFPVLREALMSESNVLRRIALKAADEALEALHFTRESGPEHQGFKAPPKLWTPHTYGEWFESYKLVWALLRERLSQLDPEEQSEVINIFFRRGSALMTQTNLGDLVLTTWKELFELGLIEQKIILKHIVEFLHFHRKDVPKSFLARVERLRDSLIGKGFSSEIRRYVAMDLLVDKYDQEGKSSDENKQKIKELAKKCFEDPDLLHPELFWLVTDKASNGYIFGYDLSKFDTAYTLLPELLSAQRQPLDGKSAFFLSGYLRGIFESDQHRWEGELEKIAEDPDLLPFVAELTWRSGTSDRSIIRLLQLIQDGTISFSVLRLFSYGGVLRSVGESTVRAIVTYLLDQKDISAVAIALDFLEFYYAQSQSKKDLPRDLALKALTHSALFSDFDRHDPMLIHNWVELGKQFVAYYPNDSLPLAQIIAEHFGEEKSIVGGFHSPAHALLSEIMEKKPAEVWTIVSQLLDPPRKSRAFHLKSWLQGVLAAIPINEIWKWVDGNKQKRAPFLANFVPNSLFAPIEGPCLAREVLVRYGEDQNVRSSLQANFSTESFFGGRSNHYQKRKQDLLEFKRTETDQKVIRWIDEYVANLDWNIEQAKTEEERRDF